MGGEVVLAGEPVDVADLAEEPGRSLRGLIVTDVNPTTIPAAELARLVDGLVAALAR